MGANNSGFILITDQIQVFGTTAVGRIVGKQELGKNCLPFYLFRTKPVAKLLFQQIWSNRRNMVSPEAEPGSTRGQRGAERTLGNHVCRNMGDKSGVCVCKG